MGLFEHFPYVNFHELNAAWLVEKTKTLLTRMDAAEARLTAAEARLTTAEGRLDAIEDEITAINAEIVSIKSQITALTARMTAAEARLATAENDIDSLEGRMTAAENDIDSLETRLTTAENNITAAVNRISALENRANAIELEISGLKTRMTAAEDDIDALEAREAIPAHTVGDAGKVLTATSSGVTWGIVSGGNLPAISSGDAGKVLTVNDAETGTVWRAAASNSSLYFDASYGSMPIPSDYIADLSAGKKLYLTSDLSSGSGGTVSTEIYNEIVCTGWSVDNTLGTKRLVFHDYAGLFASIYHQSVAQNSGDYDLIFIEDSNGNVTIEITPVNQLENIGTIISRANGATILSQIAYKQDNFLYLDFSFTKTASSAILYFEEYYKPIESNVFLFGTGDSSNNYARLAYGATIHYNTSGSSAWLQLDDGPTNHTYFGVLIIPVNY